VDAFVGSEKHHWRLHCNILAYHSESLQTELQKQWDDVKSQKSSASDPSDALKLELPEEDPQGFELLVKWLYQGKLEDVSDISDPHDKYTFAVACHRLHSLCNLFGLTKLKNMAIDQYRKGLDQAQLVPDGEELSEIYQQSPVGSPFRMLMTKIAARQLMDPNGDKDADLYRMCFAESPDFAIDLVNAIKGSTGGVLLSDPTEGESCEYHDHAGGSGCYIKGKGKLRS
jgi:hypothetical protein